MDDAAFVLRCLKGERRAYDALVRKYQNAAFGLALSCVRNGQDATEERAEAVLANIQFLHDEVEDWTEAEYPEGEKFCGTDRIRTGKMVANIQKSGGRNTTFKGEPESFGLGITVDEVFPHLVPTRVLLERMRDAVPRRAYRIMLVNRKVVDMALPRATLDDEIKEGFSANATFEGTVHGQVGRATLEVGVPRGMAVTAGGSGTHLEGLEGNVLLIRGGIKEIADITGDVFLLHSCARDIRNLNGNLLGFYHDRMSGMWEDGKRLRPERRPMGLESVSGDIELDVGHVDLKISGPGGQVKVRNRTGDTVVSASEWVEGKRWRLGSRSGNIAVRVSEDLLRERLITGTTLSGEFDYSVPEALLRDCLEANNNRMMLFSTIPYFRDRPVKVDYQYFTKCDKGPQISRLFSDRRGNPCDCPYGHPIFFGRTQGSPPRLAFTQAIFGLNIISGGKQEACLNIFLGESFVFPQDFCSRRIMCQQVEDIFHGQACSPDDGLSCHHFRVEDNPFKQFLVFHVCAPGAKSR